MFAQRGFARGALLAAATAMLAAFWCGTSPAVAIAETPDDPAVITLDLGGGVKMELLLIRPGSFTMGDSQDGPEHKVTITKPFYLGKFEVTQEQWEAVMGGNPSNFKGPKNPVENVSWNDCQTFLKKLESKFGTRGAKFSLPTEAQWEYACRAGTTTNFYFGDQETGLGEYGWFFGNTENKSHSVGQKKPNAWGLYDMHGNVFEWCADWYDEKYYSASPPSDPKGPDSGSARVIRGGSWYSDPVLCRCASRHPFPSARVNFFGLRVACESR